MTVIRTLLPHTAHFNAIGLEISKVLFTQAGLFVDFYGVPREWRWGGVGGGEGVEDAFRCFACSSIGRGKEVEGIVWVKEGAEFHPGFFCL